MILSTFSIGLLLFLTSTIFQVSVEAADPLNAWDRTRNDQEFLTELKKLNFYELLGITRNATISDIKKSYKELMRFYHPDKASSFPEAIPARSAALTFTLNQAKETLSDSLARDLYDSTLGHESETFFETVLRTGLYLDGEARFSQSYRDDLEIYLSKYAGIESIEVIWNGPDVHETIIKSIFNTSEMSWLNGHGAIFTQTFLLRSDWSPDAYKFLGKLNKVFTSNNDSEIFSFLHTYFVNGLTDEQASVIDYGLAENSTDPIQYKNNRPAFTFLTNYVTESSRYLGYLVQPIFLLRALVFLHYHMYTEAVNDLEEAIMAYSVDEEVVELVALVIHHHQLISKSTGSFILDLQDLLVEEPWYHILTVERTGGEAGGEGEGSGQEDEFEYQSTDREMPVSDIRFLDRFRESLLSNQLSNIEKKLTQRLSSWDTVTVPASAKEVMDLAAGYLDMIPAQRGNHGALQALLLAGYVLGEGAIRTQNITEKLALRDLSVKILKEASYAALGAYEPYWQLYVTRHSLKILSAMAEDLQYRSTTTDTRRSTVNAWSDAAGNLTMVLSFIAVKAGRFYPMGSSEAPLWACKDALYVSVILARGFQQQLAKAADPEFEETIVGAGRAQEDGNGGDSKDKACPAGKEPNQDVCLVKRNKPKYEVNVTDPWLTAAVSAMYRIQAYWRGWDHGDHFQEGREWAMKQYLKLQNGRCHIKEVEETLQWPFLQVDENGYRILSDHFHESVLPKLTIESIAGVTVDFNTGEFHLHIKEANPDIPSTHVLSQEDIDLVLSGGLNGWYFSFEPAEGLFSYNPFQKMIVSHASVNAHSDILKTLFHADYTLKSLTMGSHASNRWPFHTRFNEDQLFQGLPEEVRRLFRDVDTRGYERNTSYIPSIRSHRFWIEPAENISIEIVSNPESDSRSRATYMFDKAKLKVQCHKLRLNEEGKSVDDADSPEYESLPEIEFSRALSEHMDILAKYFPEYRRLEELFRLSVVYQFLSTQAFGWLNNVRDDDTLREKSLQSVTSWDELLSWRPHNSPHGYEKEIEELREQNPLINFEALRAEFFFTFEFDAAARKSLEMRDEEAINYFFSSILSDVPPLSPENCISQLMREGVFLHAISHDSAREMCNVNRDYLGHFFREWYFRRIDNAALASSLMPFLRFKFATMVNNMMNRGLNVEQTSGRESRKYDLSRFQCDLFPAVYFNASAKAKSSNVYDGHTYDIYGGVNLIGTYNIRTTAQTNSIPPGYVSYHHTSRSTPFYSRAQEWSGAYGQAANAYTTTTYPSRPSPPTQRYGDTSTNPYTSPQAYPTTPSSTSPLFQPLSPSRPTPASPTTPSSTSPLFQPLSSSRPTPASPTTPSSTSPLFQPLSPSRPTPASPTIPSSTSPLFQPLSPSQPTPASPTTPSSTSPFFQPLSPSRPTPASLTIPSSTSPASERSSPIQSSPLPPRNSAGSRGGRRGGGGGGKGRGGGGGDDDPTSLSDISKDDILRDAKRWITQRIGPELAKKIVDIRTQVTGRGESGLAHGITLLKTAADLAMTDRVTSVCIHMSWGVFLRRNELDIPKGLGRRIPDNIYIYRTRDGRRGIGVIETPSGKDTAAKLQARMRKAYETLQPYLVAAGITDSVFVVRNSRSHKELIQFMSQ